MVHRKQAFITGVTVVILGTVLFVAGCGGDSDENPTVSDPDTTQESIAPDEPLNSPQMTDEGDVPLPDLGMRNSMLFDQLANEQIVTQEQAEQLQQLMQDSMDPETRLNISEIISEAVTLGVITQEQADEIVNYMENSFDPLPDDGDFQRPPSGAFGLGMFDRFVDEGTITQEQAEQLQQFIQDNMDSQTGAGMPEIVNEAVAQGIVSQEQADVIIDNMGQFGGRMGRNPGQ